MIIFISPAKGFKEDTGVSEQLPLLLEKSEIIMEKLQTLSAEEIGKLMKVSPELAEVNRKRFAEFSFRQKLIPALDSFDGMAFKALDAGSLNEEARNYLARKLYILSGLYGALRPGDGIRPYRLDVKERLEVGGCRNLYRFWNSSIYELLREKAGEAVEAYEADRMGEAERTVEAAEKDGADRTVEAAEKNQADKRNSVFINLASEEYSKCVVPFLQDETCVTCSFKVLKNGQLKQMSPYSKKGRGAMLRYMAVNKIEDYKKLTGFSEEGFSYNEELSSEVNRRIEYVFVKKL